MSSRPANLSFFFERSEETEDNNEMSKLLASFFIMNFVDKKTLFNYGVSNFSLPIPSRCVTVTVVQNRKNTKVVCYFKESSVDNIIFIHIYKYLVWRELLDYY